MKENEKTLSHVQVEKIKGKGVFEQRNPIKNGRKIRTPDEKKKGEDEKLFG